MTESKPQLLEEFLRDQDLGVRVWWERLRGLDPQMVLEMGQMPIIDDEEYCRRGRDPLHPTYDLCDVQDFRDQEPGVWIREAKRRERLAECIVTRHLKVHQPLQSALAILLTRAAEAGDPRLMAIVRRVAAASQDLVAAERLLGMDLGTAYAKPGHSPCWASPLEAGGTAYTISDQELFDRHEPYILLLRLADGLVTGHAGWQEIARRAFHLKAA